VPLGAAVPADRGRHELPLLTWTTLHVSSALPAPPHPLRGPQPLNPGQPLTNR
jgi:hypothetical protein